MPAPRKSPTPAALCSIEGCGRPAVRQCPWCERALCDECWCKDETEHARRDREQNEGLREA